MPRLKKYNPNNRDAVAFREHRRKYPQLDKWMVDTSRKAILREGRR